MVWPIRRSLSGWHAALQFLEPVLHPHDLGQGSGLFAGFDHQKTLAIGRDIIVGRGNLRWHVGSLEQHFGFADRKARVNRDLHSNHFVTAVVEQLLAIWIPHWLGAAFGRNLLLATCLLRT